MSGYDIIFLAGQSNAEGSGIGAVTKEFVPTSKILELSDKNEISLYDDGAMQGLIKSTKPYEYILQEATEKPYRGDLRGNFAHSFAEKYIEEGFLEDDRKIIIVKAAVGGSGFSKNQWGKGCELETRAFEMEDKALSLEENSKVVAVLWHQGEHDAFEHEELSFQARKMFYYDKFSYFVKQIKDRYHNPPILAAGFTEEWSKDYKVQCKAVLDATKKVLKLHGGAFVSVKGLKSNNQDSKNGDTIHFCRESLYVLGRRYFNEFRNLNK